MARLFDYLVVENFFSDEELDSIWKEIDYAHEQGWFCSDNLEVAVNHKLGKMACKTGFFLHRRSNLGDTNIYKACSKIFSEGYTARFSQFFSGAPVLFTKLSYVLVSNYVNGGFYKRHTDEAITSVLFWLARDEKKFTGGDLYFPQLDEKIIFGHNKMIMFPSQALHEVTEVCMDSKESLKFGRYCITFFLC